MTKNKIFSKIAIEILGSGGATTIPKPLCQCRVCLEAKAKGLPYSRGGPSIFIHGPNILIDTPEDINALILRSRIRNIKAAIYSHWHPDHTSGKRIWETANYDYLTSPANNKRTNIFLPQKVITSFKRKMGIWDHFSYLLKIGVVKIFKINDGIYRNINGIKIKPILLSNGYAYAFLIKTSKKRILIIPDEMTDDLPYGQFKNLDLAVLPLGIPEFNPRTGERIMNRHHPLLKSELSFQKTIEIAKKINAKKTIMTHIEEMYQLSFRDYSAIERQLSKKSHEINFAFDSLMINE